MKMKIHYGLREMVCFFNFDPPPQTPYSPTPYVWHTILGPKGQELNFCLYAQMENITYIVIMGLM